MRQDATTAPSTPVAAGHGDGADVQGTTGGIRNENAPDARPEAIDASGGQLPFFATTDSSFTFEPITAGPLKSWRIERNSNGFFRWRWQKKDGRGRPLTYTTASGKKGYRRGSKYLPIGDIPKELNSGKNDEED